MTARPPCSPAPGPLEAYAAHFDPLFRRLAQRRACRTYLAGLLTPRDCNKTLTVFNPRCRQCAAHYSRPYTPPYISDAPAVTPESRYRSVNEVAE